VETPLPGPDDDKTRTYVPITSGAMVWRYRIIEKIGAGGMGEVFLAKGTEPYRKDHYGIRS
jgi:serine/threonine protein kinase